MHFEPTKLFWSGNIFYGDSCIECCYEMCTSMIQPWCNFQTKTINYRWHGVSESIDLRCVYNRSMKQIFSGLLFTKTNNKLRVIITQTLFTKQFFADNKASLRREWRWEWSPYLAASWISWLFLRLAISNSDFIADSSCDCFGSERL